METVKLSSKGQIVIPKAVREALHWEPGMEFTISATGQMAVIQPVRKKGRYNLADLAGILEYDGPPLSLEELCKPVDLSEEKR